MFFKLADVDSFSRKDCQFFLDFFELSTDEKFAIVQRMKQLEHLHAIGLEDDQQSEDNLADELLLDREQQWPCAHPVEEDNDEIAVADLPSNFNGRVDNLFNELLAEWQEEGACLPRENVNVFWDEQMDSWTQELTEKHIPHV